MQIEQLPVADLKEYERNSRTHDKAQIKAVAASIQEFGFTNPLLVRADNTVISGHGRLMAAKLLGMETVPCIRMVHLTPSQIKAYVIADNALAEQAGWNKDILKLEIFDLQAAEFNMDLLGLDNIDKLLAALPATEGLTDDDAIPDPPKEPKAKRGQVWGLGSHRLMCGDSTSPDDVSTLTGGGVCDMVFTDPPYNVSIKGLGSHAAENSIGKMHGEFAMASGEMSDQEFIDFLEVVFQRLIESSRPGSIHYICMDWRHAFHVLVAGKQYSGLKNICVWNKDNGGMGTFYRSKHEFVFCYKNGKAPHINNFELGQHGRFRTNVWDYPIVNSFASTRKGDKATKPEETRLHPTVKPLELVADAIMDCSNQGDTILDLFLGSGTTLLAAEKTGRTCYGMELSEKYCDVIIERWENFTGKKAELVSP